MDSVERFEARDFLSFDFLIEFEQLFSSPG